MLSQKGLTNVFEKFNAGYFLKDKRGGGGEYSAKSALDMICLKFSGSGAFLVTKNLPKSVFNFWYLF